MIHHIEHYTASQVIVRLQAQMNKPKRGSGKASVNKGESFSGTKSATDYVDLYKYGWKVGRDSLKNSIDSMLPKTKLELETEVIGFAPNVPEYLSGNPENMYTMHLKADKVLDIVVPMGWNHTIMAETILAYGGTVVTVLKSLIDSGYKVNLKAAFANTSDDETVLRMIDIVKVGDVLDIDKIASCFHASFFRRAMFAVYVTSTLPKVIEATNHGYGRSYAASSEEVSSTLDSNNNFIMFPSLDSNNADQEGILDKAIEEVKAILQG